MKVLKATITLTAYGKTEDEVIDKLLFDMHEVIKNEGDDSLTTICEVDTKDEGIDDLE